MPKPRDARTGHRRRWSVRLLAALGLMLLLTAGWVQPASAHAQLERTSPASGAVLSRQPRVVTLRFSEHVEIQLGSVRVFDSHGRRIETSRSFHPSGDGSSVAVRLGAKLPKGGYVVTWRVISADSHPVHGAFTFAVGDSTGVSSAQSEATKLLAGSEGSRTVGVTFGVARFAGFAGMAVLIGGGAVSIVLWPAGLRTRRLRWLLWGGWIVAVGATALALGLQGVYGAGLPLSNLAKPSLLSDTVRTRFGQVYVLRLVLLGALVPIMLIVMSRRPRPRWVLPAAAFLGLAVLLTPGLAGHAGVGSNVVLAIPFDLIHVTGASVWIGGLAVLAVAALTPRGSRDETSRAELRRLTAGFSQWALVAVIAIAASGGFAAWRQAGSWSAVTSTTFGHLLLVKTALFAIAVLLGSTSRRLVHGHLAIPVIRRPDTDQRIAVPAGPGAMAVNGQALRTSRLRHMVAIELGLTLAILGVTALLVNTVPARTALALPFSTEVKAGPNLLVDVTIDPTKAGPVAAHFYVLSTDGAQVNVPEVKAKLSLPSSNIDDFDVRLIRAGPGHFVALGLQLPIAGSWTLQTTVRTSDFDEVEAQPITVRIH